MKNLTKFIAELEKLAESRYKEIPEHEHTHSLYVRCLDCHMFGINLPTRFVSGSTCGNCSSMCTVKYFPGCCIVTDRDEYTFAISRLLACVKVLSEACKHYSIGKNELGDEKTQKIVDKAIDLSRALDNGSSARQALSKCESIIAEGGGNMRTKTMKKKTKVIVHALVFVAGFFCGRLVFW